MPIVPATTSGHGVASILRALASALGLNPVLPLVLTNLSGNGLDIPTINAVNDD